MRNLGLQTHLWDCWSNGQDGRGVIRLRGDSGLDLGCTGHCDPQKSLNKLLFICTVLHCSIVLCGCGIYKDKWAFCTAHLWWTTGDLKHAATTGTPYGPYLTLLHWWVSNLVSMRCLGNNTNDICFNINSLRNKQQQFHGHEMICKPTKCKSHCFCFQWGTYGKFSQ